MSIDWHDGDSDLCVHCVHEIWFDGSRWTHADGSELCDNWMTTAEPKTQ